MSPRALLVVTGCLALAALAVVSVRSAARNPLGPLVVAEVISVSQDDEGYVRIDLKLRNEAGRRVDVVSVGRATLCWGLRQASLESLRILTSLHDGETVDAPFETVEQLAPILPSEACKVQLGLWVVREESFLDFVRERVRTVQLELPVRVGSQQAR